MNMLIRPIALALALTPPVAFAQDAAPAPAATSAAPAPTAAPAPAPAAAAMPAAPSSAAPAAAPTAGGAGHPLSTTTLQTTQGQVTIRSMMPGADGTPPRPDFAALDTDHDGSISPDEASAYPPLANEFELADGNRNGKVSKAEYERWH